MKALSFFLIFLFLSSCSCSGPGAGLRIKKEETFFNNLPSQPKTLHPIRSTDYYASVIQSYTLNSLMTRDPDSYELEGDLAKSFSVSEDNTYFTFTLHENLLWSDGEPLTAEDVKFSLEAYKDPAYGGISYIPYLEKIDSAQVLSPTKVRFKMKEPYFNNFNVVAGMDILPKHIYQDPKTKLSKNIIGSGPYVIDTYIKGKILILKQNPNWVGRRKKNQKEYLFPKIAFRFIETSEDRILRMEEGNLDFISLGPEEFLEKTNHSPWGESIEKVKYQNKAASGYNYIGFNFKKALFQDKRVRRALAHLLNRKLINEKIFYGQMELARGPWYYWSDYADPKIPPIEFDPKKALSLLKEAGWEDKDKNGILEKMINGQKKEFVFTLSFSRAEAERYLTLYQEELKQVGIKLSLKTLDFPSLLRMIDDQNFDAVSLGWGAGSIDFDPKQLWHSESMKKGGSNHISYSNKELDKLIDRGRSLLDKNERIKVYRQIYRILAEEAPYIFLFHGRTRFYARSKRVFSPKPFFNYSMGMTYWSLTP